MCKREHNRHTQRTTTTCVKLPPPKCILYDCKSALPPLPRSSALSGNTIVAVVVVEGGEKSHNIYVVSENMFVSLAWGLFVLRLCACAKEGGDGCDASVDERRRVRALTARHVFAGLCGLAGFACITFEPEFPATAAAASVYRINCVRNMIFQWPERR